jgi:Zn-dependent peptidase ImmA (M78 family)
MLGGERILRHSYDLGLVPEPFTIETLNPVPHPWTLLHELRHLLYQDLLNQM